MKFDKSGSVGIEIRPHITKVLTHTVIEQSCLLNLSLIIALQNNSNEQLKENEAHDKVEAGEIENS